MLQCSSQVSVVAVQVSSTVTMQIPLSSWSNATSASFAAAMAESVGVDLSTITVRSPGQHRAARQPPEGALAPFGGFSAPLAHPVRHGGRAAGGHADCEWWVW